MTVEFQNPLAYWETALFGVFCLSYAVFYRRVYLRKLEINRSNRFFGDRSNGLKTTINSISDKRKISPISFFKKDSTRFALIFQTPFLIRLVLVGLLYLICVQPAIVVFNPPNNRVLVLLDDSRSMNRPLETSSINSKASDSESDLIENNFITPFCQANEFIKRLLSVSLDNVRYYFSTISDPSNVRDIFELRNEATFDSSPLTKTIRNIETVRTNARINSILLLSDGINNDQDASDKRSDISLETVQPIYSVGFGSSKKPLNLTFQKTNNIQNSKIIDQLFLKRENRFDFENIRTNKRDVVYQFNYKKENNEAVLKVLLSIDGIETNRSARLFPIVLKLFKYDPINREKRLVLTTSVEENEFHFENDEAFAAATLIWSPENDEERYHLTAEIKNFNEWNLDDNFFDFSFKKERRPIRILLIDETPRFEYRYLRELLRREPTISLSTLLFSASPKSVVNDPIAVASDFITDETINEYDLIILGDVSRERFDVDLSSLEKILQNDSSFPAVWFIAGERYLPEKYRDTIIGSFLSPLENDKRNNINQSSGDELYRIEATDPSSLVFDGILNKDFSFDVSRIFPQQFVGDRFHIVASADEIPIFVSTFLNDRKILWQGTDELWKLHNGLQPETYRTFVLNCVDWLAESNFLETETAKNNLSRFEIDSRLARNNETKNVVYDPAFLASIAESSGGTFFDLSDARCDDEAQTIEILRRSLSSVELPEEREILCKNQILFYLAISVVVLFLVVCFIERHSYKI